MKPASIKDYFAVLGIEPTATLEEARRAYLELARKNHPDRFDFRTQPDEWRRANEMLAQLNEAYGAVREIIAARRREPDDDEELQEGPHPGMGPSSFQEPHEEAHGLDLHDLASGEVLHGDLPGVTLARLIARQKGWTADQVRKERGAHWAHLLVVPAYFGWVAHMFSRVDEAQWGQDVLAGYLATAILAGLLMGRSLLVMVKWLRCPLKPAIYLTPLYFIKTGWDRVFFHPIWSLSVHGSRDRPVRFLAPRLRLQVDSGGHIEGICFRTRDSLEEFELRLRVFQERAGEALAAGRLDYFRDNDDFFLVQRKPPVEAPSAGYWPQAAGYAVPVLAALAALGMAADLNLTRVQERLVRQAAPTVPTFLEGFPAGIAPPENPSFTTHSLQLFVEGGGGAVSGLSGHSGAGELPTGNAHLPDHFGAVPPGDGRLSPTRSSAEHLMIAELPVGGGFQGAGAPFGGVSPEPHPYNGRMTRHYDLKEGVAPLKIKVPLGEYAFLITLLEWSTHRPMLTVFVQSGHSIDFKVPLGSYRLKYEAGRNWYGDEVRFGGRGLHGELEEKLDFTLDERRVHGQSVEFRHGRKGE